MADGTKIEWTDATWNPITGCSVVSPGCTNCYAMKLAGGRLKHIPSRKGLTVNTKAGPVWNGEVRLNEEWLTQPLEWKKPRMIFVCAHGDLFAENVPDAWIDMVFAVMALAPQHTYQVLTKRPDRMRAYLGDPGDQRSARHHAIMPHAWHIADHFPTNGIDLRAIGPVGAERRNIWLGFSAEDQRRYDERKEHMLDISWAGPKFLSAEPVLGALDLGFNWDHCDLCGGTGILARWPKGSCHVCDGRGKVQIIGRPRRDGYRSLQWIIVGGESGPNARPTHPDWVRSIRNQCAGAGVPFFFKQWGNWAIAIDRDKDDPDRRADYSNKFSDSRKNIAWLNLAGGRGFHGERFHVMRRATKSNAGRLLDGIEHSAFPENRP